MEANKMTETGFVSLTRSDLMAKEEDTLKDSMRIRRPRS
jgi:hypothetical protein